MLKSLTDQEINDYIQWLKDTGKMQYKSTQVFVKHEGEEQVIIEQRMAGVVTTTPDDWKEYCYQTGKHYDGKVEFWVK